MKAGKPQILDFVIVIVLFIGSCYLGRAAIGSEKWIALDAFVVGVVVGGMLIWFCVKKLVIKRCGNKDA